MMEDDMVEAQLANVGAGVVPQLAPDPFEDDEPLECGLENPDECEACS